MAQLPASNRDDLERQLRALQERLQSAEARLQELEAGPTPIPPAGLRENSSQPVVMEEAKMDNEKSPQKKTEDVAERLGILEKGWKSFQDSEAAKKAEAAKSPTMSFNGRIQFDTLSFLNDSPGIGYFENPLSGVDPEDHVFFRRIRLDTQGQVFENMYYRFQLDFANPNSPTYKDVYIGFSELPGNHSVQFGNQKVPLGLAALNSSLYMPFLERPIDVDAFNPNLRRIGAAAYTHTDDLKYNLTYGLFLLNDTSRHGHLRRRCQADERQFSSGERSLVR